MEGGGCGRNGAWCHVQESRHPVPLTRSQSSWNCTTNLNDVRRLHCLKGNAKRKPRARGCISCLRPNAVRKDHFWRLLCVVQHEVLPWRIRWQRGLHRRGAVQWRLTSCHPHALSIHLSQGTLSLSTGTRQPSHPLPNPLLQYPLSLLLMPPSRSCDRCLQLTSDVYSLVSCDHRSQLHTLIVDPACPP